jgi:hypothetical protein
MPIWDELHMWHPTQLVLHGKHGGMTEPPGPQNHSTLLDPNIQVLKIALTRLLGKP